MVVSNHSMTMKKFFAAAACTNAFIGTIVCADIPSQYTNELYRKTFPEPIVSASVVEAEPDSLQAGMGVPEFRIEGDKEHTPVARWKDQDCLELTFVPGTSCNTVYKLVFPEGSRYLGGAAITPREYRFRCAPDSLVGKQVKTAQGAAVLLTTAHHHTRESQSFSSNTAVNYEFRRVKRSFWTGKEYYGRRVAARVSPARVCDGITNEGLKRLGAAGQQVWSRLKANDALPGHVLVQPVEPLPDGEEWALLYNGSQTSGINCGKAVQFEVCNSLLTGLHVRPDDKGKGEPELVLMFESPIPAGDIPRIYSQLGFSVDGKGSVTTSPDGYDRKLTLPDGQWLQFRYVGIVPCEPVRYNPHLYYSQSERDKLPAMVAGGMASGLRMKVKGVLPSVVDISIPKGTTVVNGATLAKNHVHRIALNPCWPQLLTQSDVIVPLKGTHKLRLPCSNLSMVDVTLRRVPDEFREKVFTQAPYDSRELQDNRYYYRLARQRYSKDLIQSYVKEGASRDEDRAEKEAKRALKLRNQWMPSAHAYPTRRYELAQCALYKSAEMVLDLDNLAGERLTAGVYVLTLKTQANQHVKCALGLNGARADALDYEIDIPVLVTNLNVAASSDGVLVTRYSDGSGVDGAVLTHDTYNSGQSRWEEWKKSMPQGFLRRDVNGDTITVSHGDDVAFARTPADYSRYEEPDRESKQGLKCFLFTDRPLYRPGDTVHIRALLRRINGSLPALPGVKSAELKLCRPNGEVLSRQTLPLGRFGAFAADITLPEGEDNVTGDYDGLVTVGEFTHSFTVNCEVFRRDAFAATLTAEAAKVAPDKIVLRVQADDYSGVPLAAAPLELKAGETKHRLVTDAAGAAVLELPMLPEWLSEGCVTVSGSICNDRQEYVVLPEQTLTFSTGDFCMEYREGRLFLTDAVTGAPLAREQKISLRVIQESRRPQSPRALFSLMQKHEETTHSCELTVPANCRDGLPLADFAADYYVFSGTDTEGRTVEYRCEVDYSERKAEELTLQTEVQARRLLMNVNSPVCGMAHIFIGCGQNLRHIQQPVTVGEMSLPVDLREREEGTVSCSVVICSAGDGRMFRGHAECYVPVQRRHLAVSLAVPTAAQRPGQKVQLSGQVLKEGKPAPTEVTLYAVDAGMLSVAGYQKPDPERFFASREACRFLPEVAASHRKLRESLSCSMLPAVWRGEVWRGCSRWLLLPPEIKNIGFMTGGLRSGSGAIVDSELPPWLLEEEDGACYEAAPAPCPVVPVKPKAEAVPRLRRNFAPVAVWQAALRTDAEGRFVTEAVLPDTLTTYRVYAVVADDSGSRFGSAQAEFKVNLPVMITPGMPLFMSTGDKLRLPLSITNATDKAGSWSVSMQGCDTPQQIDLPAGGSGTLFFDVAPVHEGDCELQWQAVGETGTDAVQGTCKVRFPAPVLRESHHLELRPGQSPLRVASLFAPEVAQSTRAELQVQVSSSPLLHLQGCMDFLLTYPYGCTEQRSSALMPWLLYDELAPFCPGLAATPREKVRDVVQREIATLLARQCRDGGLSYWPGNKRSCDWASCYAAMALTVAKERGFDVPEVKMKRLLDYVDDVDSATFSARVMATRALGHRRALRRELELLAEMVDKWERPGTYGATVRFMLAQQQSGADVHAAFRTWMKTLAKDYRHATTASSAFELLALHDYLKTHAEQGSTVKVKTQEATLQTGRRAEELPLPAFRTPAELPTTLSAEGGTVFVLVQAKAQPEQREFPGVTEKGLQVTRLYEVMGADGNWSPAPEVLKVGDVVRVTLTCAKVANELEYLVLEDYLPACMEAINPAVPSQAAGLAPCPWSSAFDHREYLADRVRGFCTRWYGRELLNMTYYARVKRAGSATAPPAHAQMMYEPQVYGLSPNCTIHVAE